MIITGGSFKGRKVKTLSSQEVRPTSSKVRESIFNILKSMHQDISLMLDLFAGSGIMGLEALSRGAKKVTYVEKSPKALRTLKENLANFIVNYEILFSDAILALDKLKGNKFDLIFVDPPYASGLFEPALSKIKANDLLAENGIIIVEHNTDYDMLSIAESLEYNVIKQKKYGDTAITIINREFKPD